MANNYTRIFIKNLCQIQTGKQKQSRKNYLYVQYMKPKKKH